MYTLHYFPHIGKYCIFSEAMTTLSSSLCYVVFIFLLLLLYFFLFCSWLCDNGYRWRAGWASIGNGRCWMGSFHTRLVSSPTPLPLFRNPFSIPSVRSGHSYKPWLNGAHHIRLFFRRHSNSSSHSLQDYTTSKSYAIETRQQNMGV